MSTKAPTVVASTRSKKKAAAPNDAVPDDTTPVTPIVELIDCFYEDDTPVTGRWDVVEVTDGIATLWSPQQGKIQAPMDKCRRVDARVGKLLIP